MMMSVTIAPLVLLAIIQVHMGKPPTELSLTRHSGSVVNADDTLRAHAGHDTKQKRVYLSWRWRSDPSASHSEGIIAEVVQSVTVAYWPTNATPIGGTRMAVAGKKRNGETVIEIWDLATPLKSFTPEGPLLTPQPISSIDVALEESNPDRDMVLGIFPNLEFPGRFFVQYYSSRDLYDFEWDATTPSQSLVWSATSLPWLAEPWDSVHWGRHSVHGNVIFFMSQGFTSLYLIDSDFDGALNTPVQSTAAYDEFFQSNGEWVTYQNTVIY